MEISAADMTKHDHFMGLERHARRLRSWHLGYEHHRADTLRNIYLHSFLQMHALGKPFRR
jgi:hypothetical protein